MAFEDGTADFRSDTVTRPTAEMRRAMAEAPVGDDVYSDDPTVNALQEEAAEVVGKEAALFTPTGTMGNTLAVLLQTRPGEEVLVDELAHIRNVEGGWGPAIGGIGWRTVTTDGGAITPDHVDSVMARAGRMFPNVSLLAFENTHNLSGGRIIPIEVMEATSARARTYQLKVHIDGARLFNAAAGLGVSAQRISDCVDTVQFCFSKGLGAPVGSIVCGPSALIAEARHLRKRLGGGMRQAGVIAAAARVALRDRARLSEDHELARTLAAGLGELWPDAVTVKEVESNIVNLSTASIPIDVSDLMADLTGAGIVVNPPLAGSWRLVTHRDVGVDDVGRFLDVARAG